MGRPLSLAMIGTGFMGRAHSNAWMSVNGFFDPPRRALRRTVVDIDADAARTFAERWGWEHATADLGDALADDSVDAAFLFTVLGEIPDRARAMRELRRILKPGGVLSISESLIDPDYQLEDSVRDLCRASGFEVLNHSRQPLGYTMSFAAP